MKLRPKVFEALKYLVENAGRLVAKEELAKAVWPDSFVTDDSLVQCTVELRRALRDPDQQMIKTIPRRGYLFAVTVRQLNSPAPLSDATAPPTPMRDPTPAVEKLSSKRIGLPMPRTLLVGREKELNEAAKLILDPNVRLLSLTGTGGAGKTRLALAVARQVADDFTGGVQFVALSSITSPDLVGAAIVKALNLQQVATRTILQVIADQIEANGPFLLLLDNFEQVLPAAQLVSEILSHCTFLKILVTTRASLQIYGEQEFPVTPLPVGPAAQLFHQRAMAVRPNFAVTPENETAIRDLCDRLDGLPLAIELAAARTKVLSPAAILDRLQSRLQLLTGGASDLPERQKTLRKTIDWSYDLLNSAEQTLFWRFSVFVGGGTLEAAEAVCNTSQDLEIGVFEGLSSLLDKNLIERAESLQAEPRFTMLETIREYALERLISSGEERQTRRSHAAYCLVIAEEGNPELDPTARTEWLSRCDLEIDNFRSALDWLIENHQIEWALRLSMALFRFWDMREHFLEGRTRLEALLRVAEHGYPKERGRICTFLGALATPQGDYEAADAFLKQSFALYRELNDHWGMAASLNALAVATRDRGDFDQALRYFEQSLAYWRKLPDRLSMARCLHNLANAAKMRRDFGPAAEALAEATSIFEEVGDPSGAAWSINQSGDLELEQGRIEAAQHLYRTALRAFRNVGDRWGCARSLADLGYIFCKKGEFGAAHKAYREALELFTELGHRRGIARGLEGMACLAATSGNPCRALTLAAAADHLRNQIGSPLPHTERIKLETEIDQAWHAISTDKGQTSWERGQEMLLQSAVLFALEPPEPTNCMLRD
ncbi:MAG TPA: tetratricopeptide repeat protein [Terracidiphilus sp.]|nr:tetratricopeptide repeat protein [Terracidiphilus sp.]